MATLPRRFSWSFHRAAAPLDKFRRVRGAWRASSRVKVLTPALANEVTARGTAGYVARVSGGVGGRGREASSYPD